MKSPLVRQLESDITKAKKERRSLVTATITERRDMSPEELTRFEALAAQVESNTAKIQQLAELDEDDAADGDEEREAAPAPQARSAGIAVETADAPAVHTEVRNYSVIRAISLAAGRKALNGLEGEMHQELEKRRLSAGGSSAKGFFMPMGSDPELRRMMNGGRKLETRDLTTTSGSGGIFTVPEGSLIDLLRANMVLSRLGVTMMTNMKGNFAIPRQSGPGVVYWLGEGNSATPDTPTIDQVAFTPKVAVALTNISRQFLNQTSVDAESFVKNDLGKTMGVTTERVVLNGTGAPQPLGLFANPAVQQLSAPLALGANGGYLAFQNAVAMESQVATYNADFGKLGYLTNPSLRGYLKTESKSAAGYPEFVYEKGTVVGEGEINGYRALATSNVPNNITKGTGTGLSSIAYGNWEDLVVAWWDDAVDFLVNPYTNQASAAISISLEMSLDSQVRHPESFAIITDAKAA